MNWMEFGKRIGLSCRLLQKVEDMGISEEEYQRAAKVYEKDHGIFFAQELEKENPPMRFLALYCRMACDTYERYHEKGIEENIFWDTFQDIRFWCENYQREYGRCGLGAYDWFSRHMDMTLLRLGRLQFEQTVMEHDAGTGEGKIAAKSPVISIHIPQGEPLRWEDCEDSIKQAHDRYGRVLPFVCHSWLLYPKLREVLPRDSHILEFQKHFHVIETDYREREAEWRIFGTVKRVVSDYPENTGLQRNTKRYLLEGKTLGNSWGVLENLLDEQVPGVYNKQ